MIIIQRVHKTPNAFAPCCISMAEELSAEVPSRHKQYSKAFQDQVGGEKYHQASALSQNMTMTHSAAVAS